MEVQICSGCIASADGSLENHQLALQDFLSEVHAELVKGKPDVQWSISRTSCQRFCPPQRITLVIENRISMSGDTSVASVVKEVLGRLR